MFWNIGWNKLWQELKIPQKITNRVHNHGLHKWEISASSSGFCTAACNQYSLRSNHRHPQGLLPSLGEQLLTINGDDWNWEQICSKAQTSRIDTILIPPNTVHREKTAVDCRLHCEATGETPLM